MANPGILIAAGIAILAGMAAPGRPHAGFHVIGMAMPAVAPADATPAGADRQDDPASAEALGRTPADHARAKRYARTGWALAFLVPLWAMASLALICFTGMAAALERFLEARLDRRLARDVVFVVALVTGIAVLNFPVQALAFWREAAFGFSNQTIAAWFTDLIKGLVVTWIISVIFLVPVWWVIRARPRTWWIYGAAIGVAGTVLLVAVAPVFIAPIFNTFTPLDDAALRDRILEMARGNGIPADEVFKVDASRRSSHDNAYVAGLLGTQRIVLYDTLLGAYTPEEIEFVMAHEMGHYLLDHVWKGVAFASILIVAGFFLLNRILHRVITARASRLGYASVASIAALPLFLLLFQGFLFLAQPISSAVSRRFEAQADRFALETVRVRPGGADAAVSAFQRMAARNLSDPDPPAWIEWSLYSHPSIGKRIRAAARVAGDR